MELSEEEKRRMKKYTVNKAYDKATLDKLHHVQVEILRDFSAVCEKYQLKYFAVYGTAIGAVRHGGFIPWDDDVDVAMLREDYEKFLQIFPKEMKEHYQLMTPELDENYTCTVTHLQRKHTKFISEVTENLPYEQCIDLDIFPLDEVAEEERARKKQGRMAVFWGRMLFLRGSGKPVIRVEGLTGNLMAAVCGCVHGVLKLFHISPRSLYRRFVRTATRYNGCGGEYVTSFEYNGCLKDKIKKEDLFPFVKVPFEEIEVYLPANNDEFLTKVYGDYMKLPPEKDRVNHMPKVIQFEGEEPIYNK